ncbi:DUF2604 domain-containing protein [Bradyrhizobium japonicum]|uniref:DUF2604 domain-containing protein n=1 Tax=Bradyrhizobium japonicum TaxID=375 RepID=UPI002B48021D|nr:DUF2604 domain-containing protein [Bradyrhizobium japonicum]WRJ84590.1 DUF2604 domain-containing protein [Bradyrhizobium japonicum]
MAQKGSVNMSESGNKSAEQLEREAEFLKKEIENVDDVIRSEEKIKHDLEKREHDVEEEARREREKHDHDHDHGHRVRITMVVNGQPVVIEAEEKEKLAEVRQKALRETQNLAQPAENWEIKDEAGTVLDPEKRVGEYHFGKEVTLFLSLKAGVAG